MVRPGSSPHTDPSAGWRGEGPGINQGGERNPHVVQVAGLEAREAPLDDADNLDRVVPDHNLAAYDRWVRSESPGPECMAEQRDWTSGLGVILLVEQAARRGLDAEKTEGVSRQRSDTNQFRLAGRGIEHYRAQRRRPIRSEQVEARPSGRAQALEERIAKPVLLPGHARRGAHLPIRPGQIKQLLSVRHWQRAQN